MTLIRTAGRRRDDRDSRYGVFLRPDPATCWALSQLTFALRQQFGLVSAAAFPPHATLVGNLAITGTPDDLIAALDPVFEGAAPFEVLVAPIARTSGGLFANTFRCDIHHLADGSVNEPLAALAAEVKHAVMPLSRPVADHLVIPVVDHDFRGHLSVVSHELAVDPRLADEVDDFLAGIPIEMPRVFTAEWFTLLELRADWSGPWWEDQSWRQLHSWRVRDR